MPHELGLITTLAAAFGLALLLGFAAVRLGMPALVGYLLAGIAIGPATPGFVADASLAAQLAEVGVMLLMFGVGLHFSVNDLWSVRHIALPGALLQMLVASLLGALLAHLWGWTWGGALVFGLSLSVASTVVLLKALESRGLLDSPDGRIAVGWLVVEDLAMVLVLVLLPVLAPLLKGEGSGQGHLAWALGATLLNVAGFIAFMLIVGRKVFPWLLWQVAKTGSRELFTLCVVAAAVSIAFGAAHVFGVSFALGAFFAGMVLRESAFSARAAEQTLPLQDAFAVLFFVSVGMLFDPLIVIESPGRVAAAVAIVVVGKSLAALGLMLWRRHSVASSLTVATGLAQVGEFSFILAGLGLALGLLPKEGHSLVLAAALISIALQPALFAALPRLASWLTRAAPQLADRHQLLAPHELSVLPDSTPQAQLHQPVVVVGLGRVGRSVMKRLQDLGLSVVAIDTQRDRVARLRDAGQAAVWGDACEAQVLMQAHLQHACALVIATPSTTQVRTIATTARALVPGLRVLVRCHNLEEAQLLEREGVGEVFVGELALAQVMASSVLERLSTPARP